MKLTEAEWSVMEALWDWGELLARRAHARALSGARLEQEHGAHIPDAHGGQGPCEDRPQLPGAVLGGGWRGRTAPGRRADELLNEVYGGAAGDLIAAFLKETHISADEAARLRRLLDEMEV